MGDPTAALVFQLWGRSDGGADLPLRLNPGAAGHEGDNPVQQARAADRIRLGEPGQLDSPHLVAAVAELVLGKLIQEGVLMNAPAANVLRFMPPLVLTEEEVDEVVGKLATVLDEIKAKTPA